MTPSVDDIPDQIAESECNERRIFGPPGCGKTTYLGRQIERAVDKYGPDGVLITSFSRAAAAELVGRHLPVSRERVGTLHAHCYHALGRPPIAETKISDWNAAHPEYQISGSDASAVDDPTEDRAAALGNTADGLLAEVSRLRNLCIPEQGWRLELRTFHQHWSDWKHSSGLSDFTDLLVDADRDIRIAPGSPRVIFADEAQDFTPLQLRIVRQWGRHTDHFLVAGDDDQCIYGFTGATPEAFLSPDIPAANKIVLGQSYRVPRAVHALAVRWISAIKHREPKEYKPTAMDGEVEYLTRRENSNRPDLILDDAEKRIAQGQTCMFLTSCSFMLRVLRAKLLERGIPFHNPYRKRRGDWNPLGGGSGTPASARVLALLQPHEGVMGARTHPWTVAEFRLFAEWLNSKGTLTHGVKTTIKDLPDEDTVSMEQLKAWFTPEQYKHVLTILTNSKTRPARELLDWWLERVQAAHRQTAEYPCRVAKLRGLKALRDEPRAIIGTIHSVKGGEADHVYLFPDLSARGLDGWLGDGQDATRRQFYVGMTRAKQRLVICGGSGSYQVDMT